MATTAPGGRDEYKRKAGTNTDTCYNQRAEQYKVLPGMCECAATAEAAEQGVDGE